jgi:hypothetical protein
VRGRPENQRSDSKRSEIVLWFIRDRSSIVLVPTHPHSSNLPQLPISDDFRQNEKEFPQFYSILKPALEAFSLQP